MKPEWRDRLKHIEGALERDLYHPLGNIAICGFVTDEQLSLDKAARAEKSPMPEGTEWGKPWQYSWMFGEIEMPDAAAGERIVMNLDMGGEATLFINGRAFGTRRAEWVTVPHHYCIDQILSESAKPGEKFALAAEVYAGHPMPMDPLGACATGPVFPEEEADVMKLPTAKVGRNTFGIWNESAYQLWLDVRMLHEIMEKGDKNSLRVELIEEGLKRFMVQLDMEQPMRARRAAYDACREMLRPLMQAHNGSSAPDVYAVGNAHLDVCWLWPAGVTRRKTARTFAAQVRLLDRYPEAKFCQSQPVLYEMCREYYPEVFEDIKRKVKDGQWIADGAMWVEPDTNMPCGEALVRQFLYGKRYFREQFGVDSRLCWLPDTFGYSAALPQILKGCNVDYMTTQKIFWTYNDSDRFPHHAFSWQGMDGSRVEAYLHMEYESKVNAATIMDKWNSRVEHDGTGKFLLPFGYGDGGGGPTRDDYEQIRREADIEGAPKMHHAAPDEIFKDLQHTDVFERSVYVGELYFQCHRGTYTVQANVKKGNRLAEKALHNAEMWGALAAWNGADYPAATLEKCWKEAMFNQFHDILPGSSIGKVYEEAAERYAEIQRATGDICDKAQKALAQGDAGVTLFNALSFARTELVRLPDEFAAGAMYMDGRALPIEVNETGVWARVDLPACGHVSIVKGAMLAADAKVSLISGENGAYILENENLRAAIDANGTLVSLIDKATGEERISGGGNRFHFYRDVPRKFDAWDIDCMVEQCEEQLDDANVQLTPVSERGMCAELLMEREIGESHISQIIRLEAGAHKLDFDTTVDWHELHKLLKVSFGTGIHAEEARNQIQFGFIKRPTHRSRPYDADRFEVCNHQYTAICDENRGAAILNDCKYGISMLDDVLSLTLLRAGGHPDFRSDNGKHHFTYSYDVWTGAWIDCPVVEDAYALNNPATISAGAAASCSYFAPDKSGVVLETVKLAEDGSGDMILRLYESKQAQTDVTLSINVPATDCAVCNMLEEKQRDIAIDNGSVKLNFRPFEVKTLRISRA